jgi:hypothetical protein
MSAMSEKARDAAKSKVSRLTSADPHTKTDASDWTPPESMHASAKTGMRPLSRRAYRAGGKVSGEAAKAHAGRKPRKSGGMTASEFVNRDVKAANQERPGEKFDGGMKKGGRAKKMVGGPMMARQMGARVGNGAPGTATGHPFVQMRAAGGKVHAKSCECKKCGGGAVGRASGGRTNAEMIGARPEGGRSPRASGGRTKKGSTNVNIIIAQPKSGAPMAAGPMPPPGPGGPVGLHQGAPPPMAPPGAAAPMGPPPMGRKSGGRAGYPIDAGAGGGRGRLEKARAYG